MSQVASVVQVKRAELARQLKVLQRKSDVLNAIPTMNSTELELEVFDMWSSGSPSGLLSFSDLVAGLGRSNALLVEGLGPEDLEGARDALQLEPGVGMDRAAFGRFLEHLVERAGGDLHDWVSLLVLEWQVPTTGPRHGKEGDALEESVALAAADGRMRNLFCLFDLDLEGRISFKDVAVGLRKIAPEVSLSRAAQAAVEVLLWYDIDSDRSLDYREFVHFICAFCHAGGLEFGQVADVLVLAAARPDPPPEEAQWLVEELEELQGKHFADARMQKIFDLLDSDGDGYLSFKELSLLLHKFEPARPLSTTVEHAAQLMAQAAVPPNAHHARPPATAAAVEMEEDVEEAIVEEGGVEEGGAAQPELIDRGQFASVLSLFVQESGAEFEQVADYLVAVSAGAPDHTQGAALPGWFFNRIWASSRAEVLSKQLQREEEKARHLVEEEGSGGSGKADGSSHMASAPHREATAAH